MAAIQTKTICAFRTGIGNLIELTPTLRAMASMDESKQVDIALDMGWVDPRVKALKDILKMFDFVQDVVMVPIEISKEYSVWYWDRWVVCGALLDLFSKKRPHPNLEWDQNAEHETDYYLRGATEFYGYKGPKPDQVVIPAEEPILELPGKNIVLCNGGFGHISIVKKYDHFDTLARDLKAYFGNAISIIAIGEGNELDGVYSDVSYVRKLTFPETAKVIQQADLMITNDTGLMHVADALDVPTISIWGGTSIVKNKPIKAPTQIVHHKKPCYPSCYNQSKFQGCKETPCISEIGSGEIIYHVRQFMAGKLFPLKETA